MRYKYIIWDWNGTLLNDVWLCVDIMNNLLTKRGLNAISIDDYKSVFDFPVEKYYHKLGFDFERESFKDVGLEFIVEYNQRHIECALHEKSLEIVKNLHHKGYTQFILSARKQSELEREVEHFGLKKYISKISGLNNNYAAGKVEVGRRFMKELKLTSGDIVLIGDTIHDFEVALSLETNCIIVSNGHQSKERLELRRVPVVDIIDDVIELL